MKQTKELPEIVPPEETLIFAAEMGGAPSIDLHGDFVDVALTRLDEFLHQQFLRGSEVIKIIHGRGTGKLRRAIHVWLKKQELVRYFRDSQAPTQQGGVTLAVLHHREG